MYGKPKRGVIGKTVAEQMLPDGSLAHARR